MIWEILWGEPNEKTPIDVTEVDIPIADLPESMDGLTIAVVSDLHFGHIVKPPYARRIVRMVNERACDIVAVLGDIVERNRWHLVPCAEILAELQAKVAVVGCLGNHDHRAGMKRSIAAMKAADIDVLVNTHRRIRVGDDELIIAGVDDDYHGHADPAAALAGVDASKPVIVLSHSPDQAENLDGIARADLMLSGHTHGGQIRLLGYAPVRAIRHRKYLSGLVQGPKCPVYTSRGLGFARLPLRVGCRPELPIIRLVRGR